MFIVLSHKIIRLKTILGLYVTPVRMVTLVKETSSDGDKDRVRKGNLCAVAGNVN